MLLKTNLHFHTSDDRRDSIRYSFEAGIDAAARLGFQALALSCHDRIVFSDAYYSYAASRGILLIPGIELDIEHRHVLVLNAKPDIECISDFDGLSRYRADHPECFILAPHPFFPGDSSLMELLEPNIALFDAIEQSWFYSRLMNPFNHKAERIAAAHRLPFVSTSDTHDLRWLDTNYAVVDATEKTPAALFQAIRSGHFSNVSTPRSLTFELLPLAGKILAERVGRIYSGKRSARVV
jgi:predicted metal-dependent phosphoesterase TrpH